MADNQFKGITWDETPVKDTTEKELSGVTWDKPSVFEAMKQGAKQAFSPEAITEFGKQIPPAAAARMAAPVRMATGIARIPANLMRMAGVEEPAQAVGAAEAGAKNLTESAGYTGIRPGLSNLGGEMLFGGAALKGASKLAPVLETAPMGAAISKSIAQSPYKQSFLGGAALGAAGSEGTSLDALQEAGLGGLFGLGGQTIATGLGHAAAPVLKNYHELKNLGYTDPEILKSFTLGQLLGGKAQTAENIASNVPLGGVVPEVKSKFKTLQETLGSKTEPIKTQSEAAQNLLDLSQKQAQNVEQRAINKAKENLDLEIGAKQKAELEAHKATGADVHIPALDYVLEPLGKKVSSNLTGHAANNETKAFIKEAYNESLGGMSTLRLTKEVQEDLRSLKDNHDYSAKVLGKDSARFFKYDIERLINDTSKGKWLTPENWQNNLSKLSKKAYDMQQKDPLYSQALYALKDKWMDVIENQVGSELFKAANIAFSRFKIPEKAATYSKSIKAEGQVEPNELINALRSELSTSRLAGGEDKIQEMAREANKKYLADKLAIEAKHEAETQAFKGINKKEQEAFEDKFIGMGQNLAKQKAAIKKQTEANVGKHEKLAEDMVGIKDPEDWARKRLGWQLGMGSILGGGGYGATHFGLDPVLSTGLGLGTVGLTGILHNPTVQDLLKRGALANRTPSFKVPEKVDRTLEAIFGKTPSGTATIPFKQAGEALKKNAPLAGLTAAQARQTVGGEEEEYPQQGGLPVPK
jgi:hypothetical protein